MSLTVDAKAISDTTIGAINHHEIAWPSPLASCPDGADRRDDDEIRGAALQSLAWDVEVPEAVDVDVTDGWVTLTGDVGYQFQSDAAFDDVASLYGVLGVTNEITVDNQ